MTTKQLTLDDIRHTIDHTAATLTTSRPLDIVPMPSGKCLILVSVAGHPKLVHLQSLLSGLYGKGAYSSAHLHRSAGRVTVYIRHQDNVTPAHVDDFGSQCIRRKGAAQCVPYQTAIDILTASSTDPLACMRESGRSRSLGRNKEDKVYLADVVAWLQQQLQPAEQPQSNIDATRPEAKNDEDYLRLDFSDGWDKMKARHQKEEADLEKFFEIQREEMDRLQEERSEKMRARHQKEMAEHNQALKKLNAAVKEYMQLCNIRFNA